MLSCLVGARLILIVQMICCRTSAPIDNLAYFLLIPVRVPKINAPIFKPLCIFLRFFISSLNFETPSFIVIPSSLKRWPVLSKKEIIFALLRAEIRNIPKISPPGIFPNFSMAVVSKIDSRPNFLMFESVLLRIHWIEFL